MVYDKNAGFSPVLEGAVTFGAGVTLGGLAALLSSVPYHMITHVHEATHVPRIVEYVTGATAGGAAILVGTAAVYAFRHAFSCLGEIDRRYSEKKT